ncbi:MAG: AAA family ATPase [Rickettsia endosymbiont of Sergentomyia squamirostris]|uniref:AAA family ATPase n=1 Tax=Candidatus Tisiphia endosymbiont of Sergentomyia squamirostris TaxID=3113639 RepID=A0AAT9G8S9_9RICK
MIVELSDINTRLKGTDTVKESNKLPRMRVGTDDFKTLLLNSDVFVDKSLMIKELLEDSGEVILITRPRRWGKSLNMDMIRRFFEIEIDERGNPLSVENQNNIKLFTGGEIDLGLATGRKKLLQKLKVTEYPHIILEYQGQFPVIFITFKSVEGSSYHDIEQGVKSQLRKLFQSHRYLANSDKLASDELADFNHYLFEEVTLDNIKNSLAILSHLLYKHYNKKPWVLIDEYDTPINSAYRWFGTNEAEFQKVLEIFRGIMKSTFKRETGDQELPIERGVITGILRIAKAELFSGLNNVREYSLLDKRFAMSYGFTQIEVDELLTKVPLTTSPEKIKDWYNGYKFGGEIIYNPWSIMQCLASEGELDYYWVDSGGTGWIDNVLLSDEMQQDIQVLAAGKAIIAPIMKQISFADISSRSGLFSLLLFSGYLNPSAVEPTRNIFKLSAPNEEVKFIYETRLMQWLGKQLQMDSSLYYPLMSLLPAGKIEEFKERLQELLLNSTSFHQVGEKKVELFYSGFMLGIVNMLAPSYIISSEQESGDGRPDVIMIPKTGKEDNAIIIEYKIAKNTEDLALVAQMGLKQIIDKQYDTKIKEYSHVKKIIKLSIAFCGKNVELQYQVNEP